MPRRRRTARRGARRGAVALLATACVAVLGGLLLVPGTAGAATTVKAQLSLSGIATSDNPTGGSVLGVHPGDTVSITASSVPTAGLDKLGLSDLLSGLLNNLATYQVKVDFSKLPGGKADTVLAGKDVASFTFPTAGTYDFTWSAETIGLLGGAVPLNLDGNELAAAGVKLNAQNQYVGQIVVATNPPAGGISIQLPGVSVQPTLPIVGTLPKITLPGVTTPTIPVSIPSTTTGSTGSTTGSKSGSGSTTGTSTGITPVLPVPALVVPHAGVGTIDGSNGYSGSTPSVAGSGDDVVPADVAPIPGVKQTVAGDVAPARAAAKSAGKAQSVDLSANPRTSSGLPVVLAIVAMLALVLVAGTYARLFLIRKPPA